MLRDLSPLARTRLFELRLYLMNARLETLRGAMINRLVIRDRSLVADLSPIPADLPLTELVLENRPPDRSLRGIGRFPALTHVEFVGSPDAQEMAALRELPNLSSVAIRQPGAVHDLVHLPKLTKIAVYDLSPELGATVLATLRAATHLTVTVDGRATSATGRP
jgi:hypothetical protein